MNVQDSDAPDRAPPPPSSSGPRVGARGSFRLDLTTQDLEWSRAGAVVFGRDPGLAPKKFEEFLAMLHSEDRDSTRARVKEAVADLSGFETRERICWADGTIVVVVCRAAVELDDEGAAAAVVGTTELVRVEFDAGQSKASLRRAAADIGHDLRNLLQTLRSSIDLWRMQNPGVADPAHVEAALERANELGAELRNLDGRRDSAPRWTEVGGWLRALSPLMQELAGHDRSLRVSAPERPLFAPLRSRRVEHCLMNLVANARDATDVGCTIEINLELTSEGQELRFDVSDDGQGMDPELVSGAWERGTSSSGLGRGLGLGIVRGEIERMGGRVSLESELGRGTTVSLFVPAGRDEHED